MLLVGTLSVPGTAAANPVPASSLAPSSRAGTAVPGGAVDADLTAFDNRPRPFGGDWAAGAVPAGSAPAQPPAAPSPPAAAQVTPSPPGAAPTATGSAVVASAHGRPLGTFVVTCYDLQGRTASGAPTGTETVAVDPRVIPLGTHLYVDGAGERIAEDTGGAIKGNRLDIWEPTYAQCAAWGVESRQVWLG